MGAPYNHFRPWLGASERPLVRPGRSGYLPCTPPTGVRWLLVRTWWKSLPERGYSPRERTNPFAIRESSHFVPASKPF